ncbi:biogenesis of lysosome-related organelles complex 1 subunit 3 [Euwallacea fornicatus]|uniref:biogenesis of lysosome-related organelles complex 1 subunit 3 n=1 Tax=Euwallacea fornicatus TaxID=995702 RepID=UPI00338E04CF
MNNSLIVTGEASETDSEDETAGNKQGPLEFDMTNSIQGAVIFGEDSESDTDNNDSIASAVSALHLLESDSSKKNIEYDSLFQQKLRDSNTSLYNNIESLIQTSMDEAGKNLNSLEHQLLKSQMTLQGAVTSLKTLCVNSLTLKNKFHSLLSSKFLPNISCSKLKEGCNDL